MFTFKWQSLLAAVGIVTLVCQEQRQKMLQSHKVQRGEGQGGLIGQQNVENNFDIGFFQPSPRLFPDLVVVVFCI